MTKTIAFPGLGFQVELNPIAFSIGDITVKWYGIILTLGIVCAFFYFYLRGTRTEHFKSDHIYDMTLWCVPIAIVGARFMYVITTLDTRDYKSFYDVIAIWNGGIAIYGAIIAGALTVLIYCRVKHLRALKVFDAISPAVMLGQIIGRWGNFVNGECYGWTENVASLPWRMEVEGAFREEIVDGVTKKIYLDCVHPTFFYESFWNLIGFLLINLVFYKRKRFNGQIFCLYMGWYGLGRAFIESIRTDSLYITGTRIKASVLIGVLTLIAAIVLYICLSIKNRPSKEDTAEYTPKYAGISMQTAPDEQLAYSSEASEADSADEGSDDITTEEKTDGDID